jgi:hypothetical protein
VTSLQGGRGSTSGIIAVPRLSNPDSAALRDLTLLGGDLDLPDLPPVPVTSLPKAISM